jgi:tRNA threonylcarbamoyl adenosine modification protein YeaZ
MNNRVSIAIETSSRSGGLALGIDNELVDQVTFDATRRHAAQLVTRLDELVRRNELSPEAVTELYVSAGPGSFTGTRIAVTVGRTFAQALGQVQLVSVPTTAAVAENARDESWSNLAVLLAAKRGRFYAGLYRREDGIRGEILGLCDSQELLDRAPRPLAVTGEALEYVSIEGPDVRTLDERLYQPTAEGCWRVGRRLAGEGSFTPANLLLPIYSRRPEAVRLWEKRQADHSDP